VLHVDDGTLHALVDDALDATERCAVEAHLASCSECARRFAEATAMARDVTALLGALDVTAPVVAAPAVASPRAVAIRPHLVALRRFALAASLLVVASVSYEIGRREDAPAGSTRFPAAQTSVTGSPLVVVSEATTPTSVAAPSVTAITDRTVSLPKKTASQVSQTSDALPRVSAEEQVRAQPVAAPSDAQSRLAQRQVQLNAAVVTGMAAEPPGGAVATASAPVAAKHVAAVPTREAGRVLEGYTIIEDESVPMRTRRRYVSPSGTSLLLTIVSTAVERSRVAADRASQYHVATEKDRSTVRWSAFGAEYTLEGVVTPDSLMKLAAALR